MPETIHPPDEAQLVARAIRAYRWNDIDHRQATVQKHDGITYVVLDPSPPRPVIFKRARSGQLRRHHNPPAALIAAEEVS